MKKLNVKYGQKRYLYQMSPAENFLFCDNDVVAEKDEEGKWVLISPALAPPKLTQAIIKQWFVGGTKSGQRSTR